MPDTIKDQITAHSEAVLVIVFLAVADQAAVDLLSAWATFSKEHTHGFVLAVSLATAKAPPLPDGVRDEMMMCLGLDDLDERDLRCEFVSLHALNCSPVVASYSPTQLVAL